MAWEVKLVVKDVVGAVWVEVGEEEVEAGAELELDVEEFEVEELELVEELNCEALLELPPDSGGDRK